MSDHEYRTHPRNGSVEPKSKSHLTRSRTRSPPPLKSHKGERRGYSRSRSRSPVERRYDGTRRERRSRSHSYSRRSRSHSPMSSRRRHIGDRDNPETSRCLGVFGLSLHTSEQEIHHIFGKFGPLERVAVVIDAKTGRSRGFCFVYYENEEDAKMAKNECSGMEIDGRRIRVDFSITQRAHTPTPGIYMGKPTYSERRDNGYRDDRRSYRDRDDYGSRGGYGYRDRDRDYYRSSRDYRRSPSPYRSSRSRTSRRYERERSYSPRRY